MEPIGMRELGMCAREAFLRNMHFTADQARRLHVERELEGHQGCVNRMAWNEAGTRLASASDDRQVLIWRAPGPSSPPISVSTHHRANIFGVQFLPCTGDSKIVTAAMDHTVQLHELSRVGTLTEPEGSSSRHGRTARSGRSIPAEQRSSQVYYCHTNRVKDVKVEPMNPYNFWSAGEDGMVRQFDTRCSQQTTNDAANVLLHVAGGGGTVELKALDINKSQRHLLAVSCGDPYVRVFDRRMLVLGRPPTRGTPGTRPLLKLGPTHLTCSGGGLYRTHSTYLQFSNRGDKLVATYHGDHAYSFDLQGALTATMHRPRQGKAGAPSSPGNQASPASNGIGSGLQPLPEAAETARRQGNRAMSEEDWSMAVAEFNIALGLAPWCASLYARRAEALLARNWHGDALWALQDCEEAIQLDPRGCPTAYFRRVRALQALKQLQCASAMLEQYKALFPERASAEEVAATSAALERLLRQRHRQWEQWRQSRKNEMRMRQEALRSIGEGHHTPRPRHSPPPPRRQARISLPTVDTADLTPSASAEAAAATDSSPFVGPARPPRSAWSDDLTSGRETGSSGSALPVMSALTPPANGAARALTVAADAQLCPTAPDMSPRPDAGPSGTNPTVPQPVRSVGAVDTPGGLARYPEQAGEDMHHASGVSARAQGLQDATSPSERQLMVSTAAEASTSDAVAGETSGQQDTRSNRSSIEGQFTSASPFAATPALLGPVRRSFGSPTGPSATAATAGTGHDGTDSDSDSDGQFEDDDQEADHPDNPCREVLLPFYAQIAAQGPAGWHSNGAASTSMSGPKALHPEGLRDALHGHVTQRYVGQCNLQTDIKEAAFLGQGDRLVACGSDDGRVYIFCAETGLLLRALQADEDVANCCQPHPDCTLLATSGIENVIRLWSPGPEPSQHETEALRELVATNQARNREGPGVLRSSHLRALADSPHLYSLLLSQLYGRHTEGGGDQDEDEDETDPRAEVSCRVN